MTMRPDRRPPALAFLDQPPLCFVGAPKVMTTSLSLLFYLLRAGRAYRPEDHEGKFVHRYWTDLARARGLGGKFPIAALDGMTLFTVVRDPVQRLFSAYQNRVLDQRELVKPFAALRDSGRGAELDGLPDLPDPETFFLNLDRYRGLVASIDHHTAPMRAFLGSDLSVYDRVFRCEDPAALERWLSERTQTAITLPYAQRSVFCLRLPDLAAPVQAAILAHCADDFAYLKDHYAPPAEVSP